MNKLIDFLEKKGLTAEANSLKNGGTSLNLNSKNIGDEGAEAIGKELKDNTFITAIHLYNNQIGEKGAKAIGDALKTNNSVTNLNLRLNKIGSEGAKYIADALKINHTLTILNLWSNQIENKGVKDIAEALKINTSLTNLDLGYNNINSEGAKYIAKALKNNCSLTNLDLGGGGNEIGNTGAEYIAGALETNIFLTDVKLNCNNVIDKRWAKENLKGNNMNECKELIKRGEAVSQKIHEYTARNIKIAPKLKTLNNKEEIDTIPERVIQLNSNVIECSQYIDDQSAIKIKVQAYNNIGRVYYKQAKYSLAASNYIKALELNKELPKIYEKLGEILFNNKQYIEAIKCFKVVDNSVKVENCFKELIKLDSNNPNIKIEKGDYYFSIGRFDKAVGCYKDAFSLSRDNSFKLTANQKIATSLEKQSEKTNEIIKLIKSKELYHYSEVNTNELNLAISKIASNDNFEVNSVGDASDLYG